MTPPLIALEMCAGVVFFVCAVIAWNCMSRDTRHCYRIVYGVMGVAGACLALDPFFGGDYADHARTMLMLDLAGYVLLDRRRIKPVRDQSTATTIPNFRLLPIMLLAIALTLVPHQAIAAPRAFPQECETISQFAIIARSAAEAEIPSEQTGAMLTKILEHRNSRIDGILRLLREAAYRSTEGPVEFATRITLVCVNTGGNLDSVLGEAI